MSTRQARLISTSSKDSFDDRSLSIARPEGRDYSDNVYSRFGAETSGFESWYGFEPYSALASESYSSMSGTPPLHISHPDSPDPFARRRLDGQEMEPKVDHAELRVSEFLAHVSESGMRLVEQLVSKRAVSLDVVGEEISIVELVALVMLLGRTEAAWFDGRCLRPTANTERIWQAVGGTGDGGH